MATPKTRKTSQLKEANPLDGSELLHVVQGGKSRRTSITAIVAKTVSGLSETFESIYQAISGKVTAEPGKGLSTEDYTSAEKTKLGGIQAGAQVNPDLSPYALSSEVVEALKATATTGTAITFARAKIFGSATSPESGSITDDLTGASLGVVQKIYHNNGTAPSIPEGWVKLGSGSYVTSALNVIYCEWVGGTRVEYWVTQ